MSDSPEGSSTPSETEDMAEMEDGSLPPAPSVDDIVQSPSQDQDSPAEDKRPGLFNSWAVRIAAGVVAVVLIATVITYLAYLDVKSDRGQPLAIQQYPGFEEVPSRGRKAEGLEYRYYQKYFDDLSLTVLNDIEAHYRSEMDTCEKLCDVPSDSEEFNAELCAEDFHTIVCRASRSHDVFGFSQVARIGIHPERDQMIDEESGEVLSESFTGWVVITAEYRWDE